MALIPDPEDVIADYLRMRLGARVGGSSPTNRDTPWIRYFLIDAGDDGTKADHLVEAYLDLHVYAGAANSRGEASLLARSAREALKQINTGPHAGATFTGARIRGFRRFPDEDFEPARERYIVTASVWLHV